MGPACARSRRTATGQSQGGNQGVGVGVGGGAQEQIAPPPRPRGRASWLLRIKLFEASRLRSRERKMAAPAGGGGSAVSVLAPNGRRHTVKVTPSTVLLQVRPPARLGIGRMGGLADGPGSPRRGPAPAVAPGAAGLGGAWGRGLGQPMRGFRAAARPALRRSC